METPITREAIRSDAAAQNEAFDLLSDATRLDVLMVLWEHHDPADPTPLPFSKLRERLGIDDPGRLNYHLGKLAMHFVRRTEDGYELREAGKRVVRLLLSGTAVDDPEIDPVEIDEQCWYCGGQPEWSYSDGWRVLECTECDARCVESFPPGVISKNEFPPSGLLERTPDEINEADRIWCSHRRSSVIDGVCPECAGPMPVTALQICEDHRPDLDANQYCETCGSLFWMLVAHRCSVCEYNWRMPTLFYPTRIPAVVAFFYDRGIEFDLAAHEQRSVLLTFEEEIHSTDPLRIRITVPADGDELRITYDDEMNVVDVTERTAG